MGVEVVAMRVVDENRAVCYSKQHHRSNDNNNDDDNNVTHISTGSINESGSGRRGVGGMGWGWGMGGGGGGWGVVVGRDRGRNVSFGEDRESFHRNSPCSCYISSEAILTSSHNDPVIVSVPFPISTVGGGKDYKYPV